MNSMNTMVMIDVVIILAGMYLLFLGWKMKTTKKVEVIVVPEEVLRNCNNMQEFAKALSIIHMICSAMMIGAGVLMLIHHTIFSMGIGYYIIVAVLVAGILIYFKNLTDLKDKFC